MKIAILAANGKTGRELVKEAVARGHQVVAFARHHSEPAVGYTQQTADIFDLNRETLSQFDVVLDAFGIFNPELFDHHTTHLVHLAHALQGTKTSLFVVGGAGSLFVDESHQTQLKDTPDFPAAYLPLARAMSDSLARLRTFSDLNWTYLSPAADFQADGQRTGNYQLAGEIFTLNAQNASYISYADFAIAMLDVAENHTQYVRQRLSVFNPA